jgi:hypothetical protein
MLWEEMYRDFMGFSHEKPLAIYSTSLRVSERRLADHMHMENVSAARYP